MAIMIEAAIKEEYDRYGAFSMFLTGEDAWFVTVTEHHTVLCRFDEWAKAADVLIGPTQGYELLHIHQTVEDDERGVATDFVYSYWRRAIIRRNPEYKPTESAKKPRAGVAGEGAGE